MRRPYRDQPPPDPNGCAHETFHGACGACQRRRQADQRAADQRGREAGARWNLEHGPGLAERNARYRQERP